MKIIMASSSYHGPVWTNSVVSLHGSFKSCPNHWVDYSSDTDLGQISSRIHGAFIMNKSIIVLSTQRKLARFTRKEKVLESQGKFNLKERPSKLRRLEKCKGF